MFFACGKVFRLWDFPQAKNIPYQPLLIKPIFNLLANAEKTVSFKTSFPVFYVISHCLYYFLYRDVPNRLIIVKLNCVVLNSVSCAALCCVVLCRVVLYSIVLYYCVVPHCYSILRCVCCIVSCFIELCCVVLYCCVLLNALCCVVLCIAVHLLRCALLIFTT